LTVGEVAFHLRCSEETIRRLIRAGALPAVRLGGPGTALRVPAAGLRAWLWAEPTEENKTDAESQ
jgi:excisionase family DNA binding protein